MFSANSSSNLAGKDTASQLPKDQTKAPPSPLAATQADCPSIHEQTNHTAQETEKIQEIAQVLPLSLSASKWQHKA